MLKIAFVLDDGLDSEDGVQQYIRTLAKYYQQQGCVVHFLVGETKRNDIENVHSLTKNFKVSFNGNKLTIPLPANKARLKAMLEKEAYNVLHVQIPHSPLFASRLVDVAPVDIVIIGTFHILPYGLSAKIGTKALGIWQRKNLRKFDKFISVSSAAQSFAKKSFGIDSIVIPNVVNRQLYKTNTIISKNKEQVKILFLGRLVNRKGCQYLLDALGQVKKQRPDLIFHLDICGKGPLSEQLKQQASKLDIQHSIVFRGFVSEEEKIKAMSTTDIAVFPSFAGESFGIVLIEAMAAGSGVVIGGNNPGYRTVLGDDSKTLVNVKDIGVFSNLLITLMDSHKLRQQIHKQQQELVKQYDVSVVGQHLLKIYKDCINEKRAR